ncbi:MAG: alpha/beta hydrolase family esterase [Rhodoblastus sp.]
MWRYLAGVAFVVLGLWVAFSATVQTRPAETIRLPSGRQALMVGAQQAKFAVIFLHAATQSAVLARETSGMEEAAVRHGALVVFGEGRKGWWAYRGWSLGDDGRDEQYVVDLVAMLGARGFAPSQIFLAGMSNGGFLALEVACDHPGLVGGVAVVASAMPEKIGENCSKLPPKFIMISGGQDRMTPIDGMASQAMLGRFWPMERLTNHALAAQGCATQKASTRRRLLTARNSRIDLVEGKGCRSAALVRAYLIENGGHEMFRPTFLARQLPFDWLSFDAPDEIFGAFSPVSAAPVSHAPDVRPAPEAAGG